MSPFQPWSLVIVAVAVSVAWVVSRQIGLVAAAQPDLTRVAWRLRNGIWFWLAAALGLSLVGFFQAPDQFGTADLLGFGLFGTLMSLPPTLFALAFWRSPDLRTLVATIPNGWLTGLQVYRLAGMIFLVLLINGQAPFWWALSTGLADLLVGLTALPLACGLTRQATWARPAALGWNMLGLADFANSISYVGLVFFGLIMAVPAPALIGLHPLALIALFQVPLAIISHGILLGRLRHPAQPRAAISRA
ncbi:MAG: hypothetical protein AB4911_18350 [Oscillochloridaceae bacterium umkhey_bin13]